MIKHSLSKLHSVLIFLLMTFNFACSFNLKVSNDGSSSSKYSQAPTDSKPVQLGVKSSPGNQVIKEVDDLTISALPEIEMMYLTNDSSCQTGGVWESVSAIKANWKFTFSETSGVASVYGKFKKVNNEETECLKFDFTYTNDASISVVTPASNTNVKGYQVFHGTCKNGSQVFIESADLVQLPTPVSCDGNFHIGVSFAGTTAGLKNLKFVNKTSDGFRKSVDYVVNYNDNGINSGLGFDDYVMDIKVDTGYDKMYLVGHFTNYNGTPVNRLVRLNMDGTLDSSFTAQVFGGYGWLYEVAIEPATHKIYVCGDFTSYGGGGVQKIVRLNPDGSRDASFNPVAPNNDVLAMAFDPVTGKLYIGGYFTNYAGSGRDRIARLNNDGSHDTTFNPGTGLDGSTNRIQLDPNSSKIYFSGNYGKYNTSTVISSLIRLNPDGSLDTSFKAGAYGEVNGVLPLSASNKLWTSVSWGRNSANYSLNIGSFAYANGANDYPWTNDYALNGEVLDLAQDSATSFIYAVGGFDQIENRNGSSYDILNIAKIDVNGIPAKEFIPGQSTYYSMGWHGRSYVDSARGILYIVGDIAQYNGITRKGLLAISLYDGSLK